jgi:hypothetical protein
LSQRQRAGGAWRSGGAFGAPTFVGGTCESTSQSLAGDIQIGGPGTLEVLAGRNLNLGNGGSGLTGTFAGITSIGNERDPNLPQTGASILAAAGIGTPLSSADATGGLADTQLNFAGFISAFLKPDSNGTNSARYLPDLASLMGMSSASDADVWNAFNQKSAAQQDALALDIFYLVLRDAGRDHNDPSSPNFGTYADGYLAIDTLFPTGETWQGNITLTSRELVTEAGGDIDVLAPGGQLLVGINTGSAPSPDQGILTQRGGNISIFTEGNVTVGTSRIFTLQGGNEIIWSSDGNIDAGAAAKTLFSAPPARFLINAQTGAPILDLAGLQTGGGIGTLQTLKTVPVGAVDLIAPTGIVNAGDAGIRSSGNINIAAVQVLNASNIQFGGTATGIPKVTPPDISGLTAANSAAGSSSKSNDIVPLDNGKHEQPSVIIVEVLGYGGVDNEPAPPSAPDDDDRRHKKTDHQSQNPSSPVQVLGVGDISVEDANEILSERRQPQ